MTSVQPHSRRTTAHVDVGKDSDVESNASRKGIFDQFANEAVPPVLYYYMVHSSSDSEGNITLHDVKRETFGPDIRVMSDESDASDNPEEEAEDNSSRYRLRKRRIRKQRDDELDMFLCGDSSDDPALDAKAILGELSSDDETYDVTTDNWAYVRCGKKKTTLDKERAAKKNSPKKSPAKKPNKLKIKLRSAFASKKKPKMNPTKNTASPKKSPVTSSRNNSPAKSGKGSKNTKQAKLQAKKAPETSSAKSLMTQTPARTLQAVLNKKRFLRRCGYNPTAPKISEIRHIRRRQLKQNPTQGNRKSESEAFLGGNPSASSSEDERITTSEEETSPVRVRPSIPAKNSPIKVAQMLMPKVVLGTKGKTGTTTMSAAPRVSNTTTAVLTPPVAAAKTSGMTVTNSGATATSGGCGLKIVIRRQSMGNGELDDKTQSKPRDPNKPKPASDQKGVKMPEIKFIQSRKLHILKTVKVKATGSPDKPHLPSSQKPVVATKAATKTPGQENKSPERKNDKETVTKKDSTPGITQDSAEARKVHSPTVASEKVANDSNDASGNCDATNKQTPNEDTTKKKKLKKKKKKDRGRPAASTTAEDTLDAEETAMRLAMELPRHNWLVKHLIKENKLKAEDAKPLNQSPGEEQKTSEESNKEESKSTTKESTPLAIQKKDATGVESTVNLNVTNDIKSNADLQSPTLKEAKGSPESEIFKAANAVKGSSMVGIVKPFQHLKMFPASIANDGCGNGNGRDSSYNDPMSPPALCIVDEDEPMEEDMKGGKLPRDPSNMNSSFASQNGDPESTNGNRPPIASPTTVSNTANKDPSSNPHTPCHVPINNATAASASTECSSSANTSSDIKISDCFSLALDLSNKTPEKTVNPNLPLDLSIAAKQGDKSPEALDLSVKKTPTLERPKVGSETPRTTLPSLPTASTPTPAACSTRADNPPSTDVIVIEDVDDGSVTETVAMSFQNASTPGFSADERDRVKGCFVRLTDADFGNKGIPRPPQNMAQQPQHVVPQAPAMDPPTTPSKRQIPEKSLKRHVSAPALPYVNAGPSPAKRHQSVDSASPTRNTATKINAMSMLQNLTAKTYVDMNGSPAISALKRMCKVDGASPPKKRRMSEDQAQTDVALPTSMTQQHYQEQREATNNFTIQQQPHRQPPRQVPQVQPQPVGVRVGPMAGQPLMRISPKVLASMAEQLPQSPNVRVVAPSADSPLLPANLHMIPNKNLLPKPQSPNVLRLPHPRVSSAGHYNLIPPPIRPQTAPTSCRVQAQSPAQFSLYKRVPQDVNNNNVTSTIQGRVHPMAARQGRVLFNPPKTTYAAPVERVMASQGILRQMVSAPPGGVTMDRLPVNQQVHRGVSMAATNPPRRNVILPTDHPQPAGHAASRPDVQGILMQQQRAVEEKIQQLEALKQQLKMQQHNVQVHTKQQIVQQPALTNRFPAPNPRPHAPPRPQLPPNQVQAMQIRHRAPSPQSQVIRQQLQTIQSQAASIARATPTYQSPRPSPYYRNGGLTINKKDSLNEPIVIEDDVPTSQSLMARNRHSYSFHPPLAKNKGGVPEQVQRVMMSQRQSPVVQTTQVRQPNPSQIQNQNNVRRVPSESPVEVCIVCQRKAFFLCSGCKKMWYCSKECQFKDWATHSKKCSG